MAEAQGALARARSEGQQARCVEAHRLHLAAARAVLQRRPGRERRVRWSPPPRPLSRTEQGILDHLGQAAGEQGHAAASLAQLARATGVTPQGASHALRRLIGRGRLRLVSAGRPGTPARYLMLP